MPQKMGEWRISPSPPQSFDNITRCRSWGLATTNNNTVNDTVKEKGSNLLDHFLFPQLPLRSSRQTTDIYWQQKHIKQLTIFSQQKKEQVFDACSFYQ
jgi:hypothetical protein